MEQASFNFMAAVIIFWDFGAKENKICDCFHFFPIYLPWSDGTRCHDLSFLSVEFMPTFHSCLSPSSRGSLVPLHFLPLCGFIFISEVVDISSGNLDSSLWFIQPRTSHDILCMADNTALSSSFSNFKPVICSMSSSDLHTGFPGDW